MGGLDTTSMRHPLGNVNHAKLVPLSAGSMMNHAKRVMKVVSKEQKKAISGHL